MKLNPVDEFIVRVDTALKAISGSVGTADRTSPAADLDDADMSAAERDRAARLMRVNHCGEVCAQALYSGQALTAGSSRVAGALRDAANEEVDHLAWCEQRIAELGSHVSYLNPVWYASSFATGVVTGLLGDRVNLGFVAATEEEVCRHLENHLEKIPEQDEKSRRILLQMRDDEARHEAAALEAGGVRFPGPVKRLMRTVSRLMTRSSYWI